MDVRELDREADRRTAVPILQQLWTDVPAEDVLSWTGEDEYYLFGGYVDDDLVGVAGARIEGILHHDRHAWLYDLVVDEPHRGEGYGTALVEAVESWARTQDCSIIALASPRTKEPVHDFYEALDYEKWGYVIEKEL